MRPFKFTILSAPRTKKTSAQIFHIPGKRGDNFHVCPACKQEVGRNRGFDKIMPSKAFEEWMKSACLQGASIRHALITAGIQLPIKEPVAMKLTVFRAAASGDICGFLQSACDAIQSPMYSFPCTACKKKTQSADHRGVKCTECGRQLTLGKQSREGIGIILDDVQIKSTDGSRLLIDKVNPRIEITISEFLEEPTQPALFQDAPVPPARPRLTRPQSLATREAPEPTRKGAATVVKSASGPLVFPSKIVPPTPVITSATAGRGLLTPDDPDY